jgi:NTP pyrophosphatase (non-canonical NTP hydrolase)
MYFQEYQSKTRETDMYPEAIDKLFENCDRLWGELDTAVQVEVVRAKRLIFLLTLNAGLQEEAGEVSGKIKKMIRDKGGDSMEPDFVDDMTKEMGDVLWYMSETASTIDTRLQTIAEMNYEKLKSRAERGKLNGYGDNR